MRFLSKSLSVALIMSTNPSRIRRQSSNHQGAEGAGSSTVLAAAAGTNSVDEDGNPIPKLPPPSDDSDPSIPRLRLGETIRFEEWGPIVLNTDGTTRRIANWDSLTEHEKQATWRRISKRNEERRQVLLQKQKEEQEATEKNTADEQEL